MEMLMTLAIIGILTAITFPTLGLLVSTNRVEAAIDTIQVAVTASRAYATQQKVDLRDINPLSFGNATYSGTAILFTPAGEMRLVENDQTALDQGGYSLEQSDKNGYADIRDRDYITLPRGAGIVGIVRAGAGLQLLPPPFAVRFDAQGRLFVGDPWSSDPYVFYDANFNGRYQQDKTRDNAFPSSFNYVPAQWDPESSSYIASNDTSDSPGVHPDTGRHKLPFEVVETVVGLLVYDKYELEGELGSIAEDTVFEWLQNNGKALFFNRYSGTIIDR